MMRAASSESASWLLAAPAMAAQRNRGIEAEFRTPPSAQGASTSHSTSKMLSGETTDFQVTIHNPTSAIIRNIEIDFSRFLGFFLISGEIKIPQLYPGDKLNRRVSITSEEESGVFKRPLIIHIDELEYELEIQIKVGGSEPLG